MDLYPPSSKSQGYDMLLWSTTAGHGHGSCGKKPLFSSSSTSSSTPSDSSDLSSSDSSSSSSSADNSPDAPFLTFEDLSSSFAAEMKRAYAATAASENNNESATSNNAAPAPKIPHTTTSTSSSKKQPLITPTTDDDEEVKMPSATEFINQCNADKSSTHCQVFLGGACNPTTWRRDIALPLLKEMGVTFFNPQVTNWEPSLIQLEHEAREGADVLFYVLDNQTRGVVVMIEVAYFVAKGRAVVLVLNGFREPGQRICGESISETEYEELMRSQLILQDLVERHGIPVFNDIPTALRCTAKIIQEKIRPQDLKLSDLPSSFPNLCSIKGVYHVIGNKLINLKKTFEHCDSKRNGEISLFHMRSAYRIWANGGELTQDVVKVALNHLKRLTEDPTEAYDSQTKEAKKQNESESSSNTTNGTLPLDFDQFQVIMSQLIQAQQQNQNGHKNKSHHSLLRSNSLRSRSIVSTALTKLLDSVPPQITIPNANPLLRVPGTMPSSSSSSLSKHESSSSPSTCASRTDVILVGGHVEGVIPILKENGLSFTSTPNKEDLEGAKLILLHVPGSSRSVELMTMAAYYFGLRASQVVAVLGYLEDSDEAQQLRDDDEKLSPLAVKDYNRGRSYLSDMAKREGIPVFSNLDDALLQTTVLEKCKKSP